MKWDFKISQWGGGGFELIIAADGDEDLFPDIKPGKQEIEYDDGKIICKRIEDPSRCLIDIKSL